MTLLLTLLTLLSRLRSWRGLRLMVLRGRLSARIGRSLGSMWRRGTIFIVERRQSKDYGHSQGKSLLRCMKQINRSDHQPCVPNKDHTQARRRHKTSLTYQPAISRQCSSISSGSSCSRMRIWRCSTCVWAIVMARRKWMNYGIGLWTNCRNEYMMITLYDDNFLCAV